MSVADFMSALDGRVADVLESCTSCGKCVEVCPMPGPAGLAEHDPTDIAGGVLEILRGGRGPEAAERWASICSKSGNCIPACEYGVNPRFMLLMARSIMSRRDGEAMPRRKGAAKFQEMSRGERVLSRLQLPPDVLSRIRPGKNERRQTDTPPEIVFYTGCNIIKTPHIALLCLDVLDALEVDYEVTGGPANCCGIIQLRAGDVANASRMGNTSLDKFAATGTGKVVSWCPTCQIQMNEFLLPARSQDSFDTEMFAVFLEKHLERLKALMVHPVRKRVGLHEHAGSPGVNEAVRHLLEAIPGIEFVDLGQEPVGYMCNGLVAVPEHKKSVLKKQMDAAADAGVTTFAGVYHACHRELCGHEKDRPFEVVNFMELVGAAMGIRHDDIFKRLKIMNDADHILADTADLMETYGLDPDDVRPILIENKLAP